MSLAALKRKYFAQKNARATNTHSMLSSGNLLARRARQPIVLGRTTQEDSSTYTKKLGQKYSNPDKCPDVESTGSGCKTKNTTCNYHKNISIQNSSSYTEKLNSKKTCNFSNDNDRLSGKTC